MSTVAEQIERHRPRQRDWATWTRREPCLAALSYDRMRHELRHGTNGRKDELLAALVRLAQHNPDVVTVVVACLLPGLRALVARHARGVERDEALGVASEALCQSIAFHPPETTSFVAGRLLQHPKRRLQKTAAVQDTWRHHPRDLPEDADSTRANRIELPPVALLGLAVDAGVLTAGDAWLIHATRVAERSVDWAAWRLGIGYEAAKKRRQRAEARWVDWWAPPTPQPGCGEAA